MHIHRKALFCALIIQIFFSTLTAASPQLYEYEVTDPHTLGEISLILYGTQKKWGKIAEWNHIEAPYHVKKWQKILLKEPPTITEEEGYRLLLEMWKNRLHLDEDEKFFTLNTTQKIEPPKIESPPKPPISVYFTPSVGVTYLSYKQTGITDYSMYALTGKFALNVPIKSPYLDFGINAFYNVFPISKNYVDITVRYLGINARVGYALPFVHSPWRFSLMAGAYYSRMFVTNQQFGYSSPLIYPQFFPILSRKFNKRNAGFLYLKYVPLTADFAIFSPTEREVAFGLGWTHYLWNGHPLTYMIDFSDMRFLTNLNVNEMATLQNTSISLSIGYGLF